MRRSGTGSGGGHGSKNIKRVGVRTGKPRQGVREGNAAQIGYSYGEHITERKGSSGYRGEDYVAPTYNSGVPLGNECATEVGKGRPGADRTLYGQSGSQGTHGKINPGNPTPKRGSMLEDFGPDYQRKGRFG